MRRRARPFHVYILASHARALYVGATGDLRSRMAEHRTAARSFASRYRVERLVYAEHQPTWRAALWRERQIKAWRREKKVALIESVNPWWDDLALGWETEGPRIRPRPAWHVTRPGC